MYRVVSFSYFLLLLGTFSVFAQEKVLTETEFNTVWKQACERTKNSAHLTTETNEDYHKEGDTPYYSYISVKRYLPSDRIWTVAGPKGGGPDDTYEEIRIGRISYSRQGTGAWKQQKLGFSGLYLCEPAREVIGGAANGTGVGDRDGTSSSRLDNEYKYLGRQNTDGLTTSLYIHKKVYVFKSSTSVSQFTTVTQYWLLDGESFHKTETQTRTLGADRWSRQVRAYDYAKKDFKIETPIL